MIDLKKYDEFKKLDLENELWMRKYKNYYAYLIFFLISIWMGFFMVENPIDQIIIFVAAHCFISLTMNAKDILAQTDENDTKINTAKYFYIFTGIFTSSFLAFCSAVVCYLFSDGTVEFFEMFYSSLYYLSIFFLFMGSASLNINRSDTINEIKHDRVYTENIYQDIEKIRLKIINIEKEIDMKINDVSSIEYYESIAQNEKLPYSIRKIINVKKSYIKAAGEDVFIKYKLEKFENRLLVNNCVELENY